MADFKASVPSSGAGNDQVTQDFDRYLDIVNSFIKYDSHLEINIDSDTKRDIMDYIKFEAYLMLEPVSLGKNAQMDRWALVCATHAMYVAPGIFSGDIIIGGCREYLSLTFSGESRVPAARLLFILVCVLFS